MPKFDAQSHECLMQAGYEYDSHRDKYFSRSEPSWNSVEKAESGRRQGAWPSSTVDEFRAQEQEWVSQQWKKEKALRSSSEQKVEEEA
jgi:hypothetical protein